MITYYICQWDITIYLNLDPILKWHQDETRGPQALTVIWVTEIVSEGLIFAYQQPHHRINNNQQFHIKATFIIP